MQKIKERRKRNIIVVKVKYFIGYGTFDLRPGYSRCTLRIVHGNSKEPKQLEI